jgi:hypothetical protein
MRSANYRGTSTVDKAFKAEGERNRDSGADTLLEQAEDDEWELEAFRAAAKIKLDALYEKLGKLAACFKPLCKLPPN